MAADEVIRLLNLQLHPGCTPQSGANESYFAEVYRSNHPVGSETRSTASHIVYMMKDGAVSFFHHLDADEMFHFHMGDPITIVELSKDVPGHTRKTIMGNDIRAGQSLFHVVKLGTWFGIIASADGRGGWSLFGISVTPAFQLSGSKSGVRRELMEEYPDARDTILKLTCDS